MRTSGIESFRYYLSTCIFSTSIEPFRFDSKKVEKIQNETSLFPKTRKFPSLGNDKKSKKLGKVEKHKKLKQNGLISESRKFPSHGKKII